MARLAARGERPVAYCPEEAGGLGTPRPPAWIEDQDAGAVLDGRARLVRGDGTDVTPGFLRGARGALETCQRAAATPSPGSLALRATFFGASVSPSPGERFCGLRIEASEPVNSTLNSSERPVSISRSAPFL